MKKRLLLVMLLFVVISGSVLAKVPRFQLFETQNMWTFILLDTTDGRAWQCVYSVSEDSIRGKFVINPVPLKLGTETNPGRFTLISTENMWNFILLDQDTGNTWQLQYSMDDDYRFILPIVELEYQ